MVTLFFSRNIPFDKRNIMFPEKWEIVVNLSEYVSGLPFLFGGRCGPMMQKRCQQISFFLKGLMIFKQCSELREQLLHFFVQNKL